MNPFAGFRTRPDTDAIAVRSKNELLFRTFAAMIWQLRKSFGLTFAGGAFFLWRDHTGASTFLGGPGFRRRRTGIRLRLKSSTSLRL